MLVDNSEREVAALDPNDERSFRVRVAGPAALLVAKIHKIAERVDQPDRLVEKDALDVLRILQTIPTNDLAIAVDRLRTDDLAGAVTDEAIGLGDGHFGSGGAGLDLAEVAVRGLTETDVVRESLQVLWVDLTSALD